MALQKETKAELVKKFGKNEQDTGSIEVQIAILIKKIIIKVGTLFLSAFYMGGKI